jgi:hypothetical protein
MYYTSINQINGNALGFIDFSFHGIHQFGSLVNDSSTSGIFYIQNTTTTIENFYFLNNRGAIIYSYGDSRGNFVNCVFSQKADNLGNGFGDTSNCLFGQMDATSLAMSYLRTAFCGDVSDEMKVAPVPQMREDPIGGFIVIAVIGVTAAGVVLWRRLHRRLFTTRRRK